MKKLYSFLFYLTLLSSPLFAQTIRYVKVIAEGSGDGSTWANASGNLQAMINASASGDQVWVAVGTYYPTEKIAATLNDNLTATTKRDQSFILRTGVKVYGGFSGSELTTFDLSARNLIVNKTILSGDLGGETLSDGDGVKTNNAYHVVTARISDTGAEKAILDGFTVKDGYADGSSSVTAGLSLGQDNGAAINLRGGASSNKIEFSNLIIENNEAISAGGAVYLYTSGTSSLLNFRNVEFLNNKGTNGGAVYVYTISGSPSIKFYSCLFSGNTATTGSGGALSHAVNTNTSYSDEFVSTIFKGNEAALSGGAIYLAGNGTGSLGNGLLSNVLFYDNKSNTTSSTAGGGALYPAAYTDIVVNSSTFYANKSANEHGALAFNAGTSTKIQLYNSIFNANQGTYTATPISADVRNSVGAVQIFKYNLFQQFNSSPGTNDDIANNFLETNGSLIFESVSPVDINFLKLKSTSVALDAGQNSLSTVLLDLANLPRIRNTTIDLGAYEFQIGNYPLPVKLESYTAAKQGTTAVLTWKTASEKNNQKFVIERGSSANSFTFFKNVAGAGDSNTSLSYSVTDFAPLAGTNYYRLTQYDNDGKSEILGVQALSFDLTSAKTKVYPNPAKSYIEVKPSSSNGIISLNLISLTGQTISTNNYAQAALNESVRLDLTNIPSGTYILWINKGKSDAEKQTLLVVK